MSTPGVQAACQELREDAKKWSTAAAAIEAASRTAAGLTLADKLGQIPQLAGSGKAITGYDEFRQKAATALAVGAGVLNDLSTILTQAADTYEREDIAGYHRIAQAGPGQ